MKKTVILLVLCIIFIACIILNKVYVPKSEYYRLVADTAANFFRSKDFDETKIKKKDIPALEEFLSHLTHENEVIDLDKYITKTSDNKTTEANTPGVYKESGKCYIKYKDLGFDFNDESEGYTEPTKKVVCDGYVTYLFFTDFYPSYKYIVNEPKYDFIFKEEKQGLSGQTYIYESSYDASILEIKLIISDNTIMQIDATIK